MGGNESMVFSLHSVAIYFCVTSQLETRVSIDLDPCAF